jgi:hypothetical protein
MTKPIRTAHPLIKIANRALIDLPTLIALSKYINVVVVFQLRMAHRGRNML